MAKDKDDKKNDRPDTTGSVVAEDDEFTKWLNSLWAKNEPPQRLEVWQVFGRNKLDEGEMIHHEDFRPNEKVNVEQVNRIANECLDACQNDCDALVSRREMFYKLKITDLNRKAAPLVRRLGPFTTKRARALTKTGDAGMDFDDEDGPIDVKSLDLARIKEANEQSRYDKRRYDGVMGEMLLLQHNIIDKQQSALDRLFEKVIISFDKLQESQDRSLDRELIRAKEQWKLDMMQDGLRTARNLAPRIFAELGKSRAERERKKKEAEHGANGAGNGSANGNGHENVARTKVKDYGSSPERTLVDNLFSDCENTKGKDGRTLDLALFGEWSEEGELLKPGIFQPKQCLILVSVRTGRLPPEALDALMPESGHEDEISREQLGDALAAGVTSGIISALTELAGLRRQALEEKEEGATTVVDDDNSDEETEE